MQKSPKLPEPIVYVSFMDELSVHRPPRMLKRQQGGRVVELPVQQTPHKFKKGKFIARTEQERDELEESPFFADEGQPLTHGGKLFRRAVTAAEAKNRSSSEPTSQAEDPPSGYVRIDGENLTKEEALTKLMNEQGTPDAATEPEPETDDTGTKTDPALEGAPDPDETPKSLEPIKGINNRMEAVQALQELLEANVMDHVTPQSSTDEIQDFAVSQGYTITRYEE